MVLHYLAVNTNDIKKMMFDIYEYFSRLIRNINTYILHGKAAPRLCLESHHRLILLPDAILNN